MLRSDVSSYRPGKSPEPASLHVRLAFEEGDAHAAHAANRLKRPGRRAQRKALQGVLVLALDCDRRARIDPGDGLVDGGERGLVVGVLFEADDDAARDPCRQPERSERSARIGRSSR